MSGRRRKFSRSTVMSDCGLEEQRQLAGFLLPSLLIAEGREYLHAHTRPGWACRRLDKHKRPEPATRDPCISLDTSYASESVLAGWILFELCRRSRIR